MAHAQFQDPRGSLLSSGSFQQLTADREGSASAIARGMSNGSAIQEKAQSATVLGRADTPTDVVSGVEASLAQHETVITWESLISSLQSTHVDYAMRARWEPLEGSCTCNEASLTAIRPTVFKTPAFKWTQPNFEGTEPTGKQNNSQLTRAVQPSGPSLTSTPPPPVVGLQ